MNGDDKKILGILINWDVLKKDSNLKVEDYLRVLISWCCKLIKYV